MRNVAAFLIGVATLLVALTGASAEEPRRLDLDPTAPGSDSSDSSESTDRAAGRPGHDSTDAGRHPLAWQPQWGRYGWADAGVTLGAGILALIGPRYHLRQDAIWEGPILYDSIAHDFLLAKSEAGQARANRISDIPFFAGLFLGWTLEPAVAWARGAPDTALQLFLIAGEVIAITGGLSLTTIGLTGRARPGVGDCFDPEYPGCEPREPRSFPSGHTSMSVAVASYWLATHSELPIFGARWADLGFGITAFSLAITGSILRITANKHYATDVTVGILLGLGVGFGIPYLRYFHDDPPEVAIIPWTAGDDGGGVSLNTRW